MTKPTSPQVLPSGVFSPPEKTETLDQPSQPSQEPEIPTISISTAAQIIEIMSQNGINPSEVEAALQKYKEQNLEKYVQELKSFWGTRAQKISELLSNFFKHLDLFNILPDDFKTVTFFEQEVINHYPQLNPFPPHNKPQYGKATSYEELKAGFWNIAKIKIQCANQITLEAEIVYDSINQKLYFGIAPDTQTGNHRVPISPPTIAYRLLRREMENGTTDDETSSTKIARIKAMMSPKKTEES